MASAAKLPIPIVFTYVSGTMRALVQTWNAAVPTFALAFGTSLQRTGCEEECATEQEGATEVEIERATGEEDSFDNDKDPYHQV